MGEIIEELKIIAEDIQRNNENDLIFVNPEKNCMREVDGKSYERYAVKTHLITKEDNIVDVVKKYAAPHMQNGDIVFISEKAVACTQNRAFFLDEITPRPLAKFLSKFVTKSSYGIGLAMPETMEMALRECGTPRILLAAACSAIGKVFGKKGVFYNVAGEKARAIDGPTKKTIPPLNRCVVLGPEDPMKVCKEISQAIGFDALIIDANDFGVNILGCSNKKLNTQKLALILADNPLGQCSEQTPMGIIRQAKN